MTDFIFKARILYGYFTYRNDVVNGIDTRIGQTEIPTGRSLSGLRARATRIVKASPDMLAMLSEYLDEESQQRFQGDPGLIWKYTHRNEGWEDWKEPTAHATHEGITVTSRWKWLERREWHRAYSVGHGGAKPAPVDVPDIRAYYAIAYEGILS